MGTREFLLAKIFCTLLPILSYSPDQTSTHEHEPSEVPLHICQSSWIQKCEQNQTVLIYI